MVLSMSIFLDTDKILNFYNFNMILYLHVSFHNDACCTSFVIPTFQFIAYHNDSFFI